MAFRAQARLKSQHVAWDPSAMKGTGRINKAHLRGRYVNGGAAALVAGREADWMKVKETGTQGPLPAASTRFAWSPSTATYGARRRLVGDGRGRVRGKEVRAGRLKGVNDPPPAAETGDHGGRVWRGSYHDGKPNKHAGGHTREAEALGFTPWPH